MHLNPIYSIDAVTVPAAEFTVTVAAGKVSSDLVGFPLMIDLHDMPSGFWSGVDASGGNIRAYAADGTTLIPHDVTYVGKPFSRGRMFVRTNLATASATTIKIKVLSSGTAKLAATDPNGRNSVWTGYGAVVVFPEKINRVDGSVAYSDSGRVNTSQWKETAQEAYVAHNGVAFDGTYHYAVDDNYIRKYSTGLTVVATNTNPCAAMNTATGETTLDHTGSPTIIDGELWVPIEVYPAGTYNKQYIGRFRLSDLTLIGYIRLTGATRESSALIYDSALDRLYVTDYTNGTSIPYFNKATGAYVGALALSTSVGSTQGICELGGKYYLSSESMGGVVEVEKDGTVNGVVLSSGYSGQVEGLTTHGGELIWTKGNTRHYKRDTEFDDWARIHNGQLGFSVAKSTVWTAVASWQSTISVIQQAIIGVYAQSDSNDRHSAMFDSPSSIGLWNTSNGWLYPSPAQDADATPYLKWRCAFAQNGSAGRKVLVNGGNKGEAGTSSARPLASGNMVFDLAGGAAAEPGFGHYQFFWARPEYMSDAWLAADNANMSNPATFYSIS